MLLCVSLSAEDCLVSWPSHGSPGQVWLDPVDGETRQEGQRDHYQPGQDRMEREEEGEQAGSEETGDAPGELEEGKVAATQGILTHIGSKRVGGRIVYQFGERIHAGDDEEKGDQKRLWHQQGHSEQAAPRTPQPAGEDERTGAPIGFEQLYYNGLEDRNEGCAECYDCSDDPEGRT